MAYNKANEHFLERLNEIVEAHLEDAEMDVAHLARYINMSRSTLYRKIKAISNLTPNELINITHLKKAAPLLAGGEHKINEIAEKVGHSSATNFGRNFYKQFNITPSEYCK